MKLHWFHLAPWQNLPKDFNETYRSVWVDVPSHLFNPVQANHHYNDFLDELELAERFAQETERRDNEREAHRVFRAAIRKFSPREEPGKA